MSDGQLIRRTRGGRAGRPAASAPLQARAGTRRTRSWRRLFTARRCEETPFTPCSRSAIDAVVAAPARMSEWPPMYFVAEWIATSTPGTSRQRWWKGVAKVESHITHGLACPAAACFVTTSPTASRSVSRQVGFAGDSAYTTYRPAQGRKNFTAGRGPWRGAACAPPWWRGGVRRRRRQGPSRRRAST